MNINVGKISKNFLRKQEICSHGVIREIRPNMPDTFRLSESKLSNIMPSFDIFVKEKNPNPANLTKELSDIPYSCNEVKALFKRNPNLNRTVGALPESWERRIGDNKLLIDEVDNTFTKFAQKAHQYGINQKDIDFMQIKLSAILGTDVKVSYLGQGSYGKTYKINANSEDYVLKVYFNRHSGGYGEHGNHAELASAVYAAKNETDAFTTFYMGHFGQNDDGYMLTKFVEETKPIARIVNGIDENSNCNFVFCKLLRKIESQDCASGNKLGTKIVDFGGLGINDSVKLEPNAYEIAKLLGDCLDTNNEKELNKLIQQHKDKPEFKQAVGFLQYLINKNCVKQNYKILESKKELLAKLELDYLPDIRFLLSHPYYLISLASNEKDIERIFGFSANAFRELRTQYEKILPYLQKS